MKTMTGYLVASTMLMFTSTAWAVDTTQTYTSGILVLLFVGFCALVVVAQLIPALVMLYGWVKSLFAGEKLEAKSYHHQ